MNIFVGASSKDTNNESYNQLAENIGNYIVENKHNYVFGAYDGGLMGKIYEIVKQSESKVIGASVEIFKGNANRLKVLDSKINISISNTVNERKNELIKNADVIIIIPGGFGTIDELFACIEAKRAGEHVAPIFIVNIDGYYNSLLDMIEKVFEEKFANEDNRSIYKVCDSFEELKIELDKLSEV